MCTAMPATSSPRLVTSPACSPLRTSSPLRASSSRMCHAQRIARAGPSNVASIPSPAVLVSRRRTERGPRAPCARRGRARAASSGRPARSPLRRADDVHEEHGCEHAIRSANRASLPRDELLDRPDEIRLGERPVVGALALQQRGARYVLREIAPVADAHELVVAVVHDERGHVDERQQLAHVDLHHRLPPVRGRVGGLRRSARPVPTTRRRPVAPTTDGPRNDASVPLPHCVSTFSR